MLIWEMLHDFIILTTCLLYLFNQGDFHESFLFFLKAKNWKLKFTGALEKIHNPNHGYALLQNLWFWVHCNFCLCKLVSLVFVGRFSNPRYVNLSWRLMNLANYSESNDILSLRSYFQSKGGTFLRHRYVSDIKTKMLIYQSKAKTAFTRCRHILKTMKKVTVAKFELAFTRCRHNLKTVGNLTIKTRCRIWCQRIVPTP